MWHRSMQGFSSPLQTPINNYADPMPGFASSMAQVGSKDPATNI